MKQRTFEELLEDYCSFAAYLDINDFDTKGKISYTTYITNFSSKNITGAIIIIPDAGHFQNWRYAARVYADNRRCFHKYSSCPFRMMLPMPQKFEAYLKAIKYWGSDKGYQISNTYNFKYFITDI